MGIDLDDKSTTERETIRRDSEYTTPHNMVPRFSAPTKEGNIHAVQDKEWSLLYSGTSSPDSSKAGLPLRVW